MEFHIQFGDTRVDIESIEQRLLDLDPAGMVDLDLVSGRLRVSTLAPLRAVAGVLAAAGHQVALHDIQQQPSACCGGCGG